MEDSFATKLKIWLLKKLISVEFFPHRKGQKSGKTECSFWVGFF